jgi:Ca-activated chloride channel homolog
MNAKFIPLQALANVFISLTLLSACSRVSAPEQSRQDNPVAVQQQEETSTETLTDDREGPQMASPAAADYPLLHKNPAPSVPHKEKRLLQGSNHSYRPLPRSESYNTESYTTIRENAFLSPRQNPLSTFSIDVDEASYTNCRRYISSGSLPPADAVRIEELVNYFDYAYSQPRGNDPFSITAEMSECPWNRENRLIHIGLQGKTIDFGEMAPLNLVFLVDVSGSMGDPNKLPLVKSTLKMLAARMRTRDRISLVVYAGAAGLVLPSTPGNEKERILEALDRLEAGGSTAGGEGIRLAYKIARENRTEKGINRILLATDGDFNVGVSSDAEMTRLVEEERKHGAYLTVLGFGTGNYKDSRMEAIADNGNGNYFYIDNVHEARKVLVTELTSTLCTIARDVKIQIEFNPLKVKGYRLIGYENRKLAMEDFNNDRKDAGELGAGHTVTALYEIIPAGSSQPLPGVDPLRYQETTANHSEKYSTELMTVKFRYKHPADTVSRLITQALTNRFTPLDKSSDNFRFSAAVASFGQILRGSAYKGNATMQDVISLAESAKGTDSNHYRSGFIEMVKTASLLREQASGK